MKPNRELAGFELEVVLTLYPRTARGMERPIFSGDRAPHIYLEGGEWMASFQLQDRELLYAGDPASALVQLVFPREWADKLRAGTPFLVRYVGRNVGEGVISALRGPTRSSDGLPSVHFRYDRAVPVPHESDLIMNGKHLPKHKRHNRHERHKPS